VPLNPWRVDGFKARDGITKQAKLVRCKAIFALPQILKRVASSLKPRGIERLGDRAQSPVEFVLAHLQVRDLSARNEVSGHLLFCMRLPHTFMRWTTNYSAETNPNVVIRQAASYDQRCGGYPVTLLPCQGPTLRSGIAR
jgi:hypothetical protein